MEDLLESCMSAIEDCKMTLADHEYMDLMDQLHEAYKSASKMAECGCTENSFCFSPVVGDAIQMGETLLRCQKLWEVYKYCPLYTLFTQSESMWPRGPRGSRRMDEPANREVLTYVTIEWLKDSDTCDQDTAVRYLLHFVAAAVAFRHSRKWRGAVLASAALLMYKFYGEVSHMKAVVRFLKGQIRKNDVIARFFVQKMFEECED